MTIQYDEEFLRKLKLRRTNVRIRNKVKAAILKFSKTPYLPELNNHALKDEWSDHRSINGDSDLRIIFIEKKKDKEVVSYFVTFGSHKELFC